MIKELNKVMFGVDVNNTDAYIKNLMESGEINAKSIESEIEKYNLMYTELQKEHSELKKYIKNIPYSLSLLNYAVDNIDIVIESYTTFSKETINKNNNELQERIDALKVSHREAYTEFVNTLDVLKKIEKELEALEAFETAETKVADKKDVLRDEKTKTERVTAKIIQYRDRARLKTNSFEAEDVDNSNKTELVEKKDIVKTEDENQSNKSLSSSLYWNNIPYPITADGLSISNVREDKDGIETKALFIQESLKTLSNSMLEVVATAPEVLTNKNTVAYTINLPSMQKNNSFWDTDIALSNSKPNKDFIDKKNEMKNRVKTDINTNTMNTEKQISLNKDTNKYAEDIENKNTNKNANSIENRDVQINADSSENKDNEKEKLKEEIKLLQMNYIIGKVSGKDILSKNGKIIIAKNQIITSETIDLCTIEGKMPELIINMLLPELGD